MTKVKICGITNSEDALEALRLGADAIGLVFAKSPRRVTISKAKEIIKAVGPWTSVVGVFAGESLKAVEQIARDCRLSAIQLHGDEDNSYVKRLSSFKIIKAFRIADASDLKGTGLAKADALLFDTKIEGELGGTGKRFDWGLLSAKKFNKPVIISGGLNPRNVRDAIQLLHPYGVDVSSGVESAPGKKDFRLMREFIQNVKK